MADADTKAVIRLRNLTGGAITVYADGVAIRTLAPDEARAQIAGAIASPIVRHVAGLPVRRQAPRAGLVRGVPPPAPDTALIVPDAVYWALCGQRDDLLMIDTGSGAIRRNGTLIGTAGFTIGPSPG